MPTKFNRNSVGRDNENRSTKIKRKPGGEKSKDCLIAGKKKDGSLKKCKFGSNVKKV